MSLMISYRKNKPKKKKAGTIIWKCDKSRDIDWNKQTRKVCL